MSREPSQTSRHALLARMNLYRLCHLFILCMPAAFLTVNGAQVPDKHFFKQTAPHFLATSGPEFT